VKEEPRIISEGLPKLEARLELLDLVMLPFVTYTSLLRTAVQRPRLLYTDPTQLRMRLRLLLQGLTECESWTQQAAALSGEQLMHLLMDTSDFTLLCMHYLCTTSHTWARSMSSACHSCWGSPRRSLWGGGQGLTSGWSTADVRS
jgi:hypothetical protein